MNKSLESSKRTSKSGFAFSSRQTEGSKHRFRPVWRFAKQADLVILSVDRAVAQPGLARYLGVVEVVGSNPAGPTFFPKQALRLTSRGAFSLVATRAASASRHFKQRIARIRRLMA